MAPRRPQACGPPCPPSLYHHLRRHWFRLLLCGGSTTTQLPSPRHPAPMAHRPTSHVEFSTVNFWCSRLKVLPRVLNIHLARTRRGMGHGGAARLERGVGVTGFLVSWPGSRGASTGTSMMNVLGPALHLGTWAHHGRAPSAPLATTHTS